MTLERKIGQMLMFGWMGGPGDEADTLNSHVRELVQEMEVGGIVLLGRNISSNLADTVRMLNELQAMSREPLLVNVDQEGGMVARFSTGVTVFPSNMALGAAGDPHLAYEAAAATAVELSALGVNYNFAPSVDVNNNPENPIIGTRSYGESPDTVSEFGVQAIRGYQENGVIACAKHFPGHGDTAVDSHLALPSVPYTRERLDEIELKPFRAAIAAGVSSIMTTHIMFPALDTALPSTLSPAIITGLLRDEYRCDSVITTDCMEMKAIADNWGTAEGAVMAVQAGVDIVLVGHTLSVEREVREALLKAVKDGRISEDRIDESVRRITAMKHRYSLHDRRFVDPDRIDGILCRPEHVDLRNAIARRAVTLVRNENGLLPVGKNANVLVAGLHETVAPLADALGSHGAQVTALKLEAGDAAISQALEAAARADVVIVPTCPNEPWKPAANQALQTGLVKELASRFKRLAVVAVREPYDLRKFPQVRCYICAYGYRGGTLDAAAALIMGEIEPRGTLPVTLPDPDGED